MLIFLLIVKAVAGTCYYLDRVALRKRQYLLCTLALVMLGNIAGRFLHVCSGREVLVYV